MYDSLIVDDNFLSLEKQKEIQNFVFSNHFPWFMVDDHVTSDEKFLNNYKKMNFFSHNLYDLGRPQSNSYDDFLKIFNIFTEKHSVQVRAILRARLNLSTSRDGMAGHPHVDWKFDHNVFIYYINDSDGDTIIYNQSLKNLNKENLLEINRVSPKMGKGVIFSGNNLHSASNPLLFSNRVVLNISFV